jgi:hypothetical protein
MSSLVAVTCTVAVVAGQVGAVVTRKKSKSVGGVNAGVITACEAVSQPYNIFTV